MGWVPPTGSIGYYWVGILLLELAGFYNGSNGLLAKSLNSIEKLTIPDNKIQNIGLGLLLGGIW